MKRGKACDIYKLNAEHLKNAGTNAKTAVLNLINDLIENIEYFACPQVKSGISTAAYTLFFFYKNSLIRKLRLRMSKT